MAVISGSVVDEGVATVTDRVDVLDPATGELAAAGSLLEERQMHTTTRLEDGRLLVIGGQG